MRLSAAEKRAVAPILLLSYKQVRLGFFGWIGSRGRMADMLVCGAGGFIGSHLVKRLKAEGHFVRAADLHRPRYAPSPADEFMIADLRDPRACAKVFDRPFDEVYQLAADMGGAGYAFSGENDADILRNSAAINTSVLSCCRAERVGRIFYSSSACVYPRERQADAAAPDCRESTAYPANPDSDYGWEKLFAERLYQAHARNYGLSVRIARYHNIFGPEGSWNDGREKVPAAMCRKVALASDGGTVDIWGNGAQTRSFLYIDECLEGTLQLMRSAFPGPVNIGSAEMVSIDTLAEMIAAVAGKRIVKRHELDAPVGVAGRNSDNTLILKTLGWAPSQPLAEGLRKTYHWVARQLAETNARQMAAL